MVKMTKAQKASLTADALYLGCTIFGRTDKLVFGMRESRPSDRTQAALDELVAAGLVGRVPVGLVGVEYRPDVEFPSRAPRAPAGDWPITVPLARSTQPGESK
jgi:hypothetical protein